MKFTVYANAQALHEDAGTDQHEMLPLGLKQP